MRRKHERTNKKIFNYSRPDISQKPVSKILLFDSMRIFHRLCVSVVKVCDDTVCETSLVHYQDIYYKICILGTLMEKIPLLVESHLEIESLYAGYHIGHNSSLNILSTNATSQLLHPDAR